MTDPTTQDLRTTTERELIQKLADSVELLLEMRPTTARPMAITQVRLIEARAYLAQPEPETPTDEELLELMPETMRDEFAYSAKACSDLTGGQVKPGIFRVSLNHSALEYARAVLARWGHQSIPPIPLTERQPTKADCDAEGRCWWGRNQPDITLPDWYLDTPKNMIEEYFTHDYWLPHWAFPVPESTSEGV